MVVGHLASILALENFRKLRGSGWSGFSKMHLWRQDKGQVQEMKALVEAVNAGARAPIPFDEIVEVTRATLRAVRF